MLQPASEACFALEMPDIGTVFILDVRGPCHLSRTGTHQTVIS
jgi:hypothetical protein